MVVDALSRRSDVEEFVKLALTAPLSLDKEVLLSEIRANK